MLTFKGFDLGFNKKTKSEEKLDFVSFCLSVGYPQPFNKQIEMRDFAFKGKEARMILGARGYGKTDYITILGLAYYYYLNNNYKAILITKEQERGKEIVAEIRSVLELAGVEFKSRAKKKLILKGSQGKEPNLVVLTVRSKGLRGRHPNLVIMEDVITPDDTSETERKRVQKMYEEVYKLTDNILLIGQPVHKLDLYQKLRHLIPTLCVKYGDIPELDVDLEAQRCAGVSEESIQASYFLNILDDNSLPFGNLEVVDYHAIQNVAYIDPAHKGKDYTAISIGGRYFNKLAVIGFVFQKAWYDCVEEFAELGKIFKIGRFCIETNGLGDMPVNELRRLGCPCVGHNSTKNKHKRIVNTALFSNDIKLFKFINGSAKYIQANQTYIDQTKNYEYNAKNDDAPDSLAGLTVFMGLVNDV